MLSQDTHQEEHPDMLRLSPHSLPRRESLPLTEPTPHLSMLSQDTHQEEPQDTLELSPPRLPERVN